MSRKTCLVWIFSLVISLYAIDASAEQKIMPLEEVERLLDASPSGTLNAYFDTVEKGTVIKSFNITIRGVYKVPGLKIIMFVSSHRIAAGMSGSPVYLKGQLVGAVAYSFGGGPDRISDQAWGGISPASLMMEQSNLGLQEFPGAVDHFNYNGMRFDWIPLGDQSAPRFSDEINSKLDPAGLFRDGKFVITTRNNVVGQQQFQFPKKPVLKAGMPIVVDLLEWKDEKGESTSMSAMGTITYISDSGRIFGFGHPFLGAKKVVYAFRTAEVLGTVFAKGDTFKLGGKNSEVLGAITYDGSYGIYGSISLDELKKLHSFELEFKNNGKPAHKFGIKVADSSLTPLLAQNAFKMIGDIYDAPVAEEPSVTQLDVKVELENHEPVTWKEMFASGSVKFGGSTTQISSYQIAYGAFFEGVYDTLVNNKYGLKISNVFVTADFTRGKSQVFKVGAYKFPNKVVWGQSPMLEVLMVSQDNITAIAKKIPVQIDWSRVEKPVYTKDTMDIDKNVEKVVGGMLTVDSATSFFNNLAVSERQKFQPEYFLNSNDFLENFSRSLERTNQKIFVKVMLRSRSGLMDEAIANAKDIIPSDVSSDDKGWKIIVGGLKERKNTVKDGGLEIFYADLPDIPSGYVIDQRMHEVFRFEVISEK